MIIPFSKPLIDQDEERQVLETLQSGWLTTGPKAHEFEEAVKRFLGVPMAVAVSSCTAALEISLAVMGCKDCDVITTPYTFASTVLSIIHQGGHPVFVDIDPDTFNIDPMKIEEKIKEDYSYDRPYWTHKKTLRRLAGILPVHFAGVPADMVAIQRIADKYNLWVIEDAAHAFGSHDGYNYVGKSPNLVCFSFYANKNITSGEGGMIVSLSQDIEILLRQYSNHGLSKSIHERAQVGTPHYDVVLPGFKSNMSDVLAAIGVAQMGKLPEIIRQRQAIKKSYDELLAGHHDIQLPWQNKGIQGSINYHLYPARVDSAKYTRDEVLVKTRDRGISCSIHFQPVHAMTYFQKYFGNVSLPIAEGCGCSEISLPFYPGLTQREIEYICENLIEIVEKV